MCRFFTVMLIVSIFVPSLAIAQPPRVFRHSNLVPWCIVPFDAKKRSPTERAAMLKRLGFSKIAYDWRQQHVREFEDEILALKKHNIEFFAFWGEHERMFQLFAKYKMHPQIWKMIPNVKAKGQARVEAAARALLPLVHRAKKLGCKVGLYNHGGWGGEPENMIAVCRWLRKNAKADHVGIVWNLHHGHDHINDFATVLKAMKPYLLCLNLNGMNDGARPKILAIGKGKHDQRMLRIIGKSGYTGPIGVLDHRSNVDAEVSLRENLIGLRRVAGLIGKKK